MKCSKILYKNYKLGDKNNKMGKLILSLILLLFIIPNLHCQDIWNCDTVRKENHLITEKCIDSTGEVLFRVSRPGCVLIGLDARPMNDNGPIISICFPYDTYISEGGKDYDVTFYTYGFVEDQFMVILIDTNHQIEHLFDFDSILSEEDLSAFLEHVGGWIPLNGKPGEILTQLFERTPKTQEGRTTMAIKGKYSQILLYNIRNEKLEDFVESAKSLFLYELKRIQ